ncbi:MAG: Aspartokinase [Alphaproteobacteria bacterium ADurb.Bin438]|nr:MAG: Aspartokinase [Alphaproteobacteria bacterium ADurb.Bin438]
MALIVQKYGGTSVADVDRIKIVANKVKNEIEKGNQVVVILSAMSGVTNSLVKFCNDITTFYDNREYDAVVATGEQVTIGLLAIALQNMGIKARSYAGWQVPIITDNAFGKARIKEIKPDNLLKSLENGEVPIIAGFQGIEIESGRVATLGRGGSDTSAVAVAAAINADCCDIFTDVEGVYTTDPRIVKVAKKLEKITFEEILEMASLGAKVLQTRSVELAMKYKVKLRVLSSFVDAPGTLICSEDEIVEKEVISGITYNKDEAKFTLVNIDDVPGVSANIFKVMSNAGINVDMIVQSVSSGTKTNMTFTVPDSEFEKAKKAIEANKDLLNYESFLFDRKVVKVSIVGIGMKSHSGVAETMFRALAEKNINIMAISTSEIKISVLIADEYTELALRVLHTAFGLDKEISEKE